MRQTGVLLPVHRFLGERTVMLNARVGTVSMSFAMLIAFSGGVFATPGGFVSPSSQQLATQQEQARQEQLRQQQLQLQADLQAKRQQSAQNTQPPQQRDYGQLIRDEARLNNQRNSQQPIPATIGPATQPSYPMQQDWRGAYYVVPQKTIQNPNGPLTGPGSLSTNQQQITTNQTVRVGPDKLKDYAIDAAVIGTTAAIDVASKNPAAGSAAGAVVREALVQETRQVIGKSAVQEGAAIVENQVAKNASVNTINSTAHGLERIAGPNATRGGVLDSNTFGLVKKYGDVLIQPETLTKPQATVHVLKNTNGEYNFAVISNNGDLITSGKNWSEKAFNRLKNNYGWE